MAYLLILDDDEDFDNTAATVLRKEGHNVQIELDTDDAVQSMENKLLNCELMLLFSRSS